MVGETILNRGDLPEVNMSTQTITLSLPAHVVQQAEAIAARRHVTVARLLAESIEELVARETRYARARTRQLAQLRKPFNLGTGGRRAAMRESLHER